MELINFTLELPNCTIRIGDCGECLKFVPDASIDVIVTSPPYNIGVRYMSYHDSRPETDYLRWMSELSLQFHRVLKPRGSFFLNVGSTNAKPWLGFDVANVFREDFILQNHIAWIKSISIGDDTVGHFKPINSSRYLNHNHENIFHFTKPGNISIDRLAVGVPFKDKSNIRRRGHGQDKRCAGNVWFIPYDTVQNREQKFGHPAGFPVELPRRCLKLHGGENLVVLDPFLGAGTTMVAARELGHRSLGIEMDNTYALLAFERLKRGDTDDLLTG